MSRLSMFYHTPLGYNQNLMGHIDREKQKLAARIKRVRGQVDSIDRILTAGNDEDHIRHHLLSGQRSAAPPQ
jgi:DNA-binding FrmR family transcriptional regulator